MDPRKPSDNALRKHPTPAPGELAFSLDVTDEAACFQKLLVRGTAFKDMGLENPPGIGSMVGGVLADTFVFTQITAEVPGYLTLYFLPPKTAAELAVPFDEFWSDELPPTWPAVLRRVSPEQDDNLPLSAALANDTIANAARNYVTVDVVPPTQGGRVRVKLYYGPGHHACAEPERPVETTVNWDIPGASNIIPCLHDDIYVPAVGDGGLILTGTAAKAMAKVGSGEFFPATEMKTWETYHLSDGERPRDALGGCLRIVQMAHPPDMPAVSTRDRL